MTRKLGTRVKIACDQVPQIVCFWDSALRFRGSAVELRQIANNFHKLLLEGAGSFGKNI